MATRTALIATTAASHPTRNARGSVSRRKYAHRTLKGSTMRIARPAEWKTSSRSSRSTCALGSSSSAGVIDAASARRSARLGGSAGDVDARVRRDVLLQELHLVGEDAAIGEDEELRAVRNVRGVEQLHVRLFRRAAALPLVAGAARRDHVHPRVAPAARHGQDVVAGQPVVREVAAAEGAHEAVAVEELA